jgi:hypothetical protein
MGRNTTADKTPLLTDAEQNIGNSSVVLPQPGSVGTCIPQTNPPRILNLSAGGSAAGQTLTVTFTLSRIIQSDLNPYPGFPGPVTGVLEYGNGGRSTRIEFDLTVGPFAGRLDVASQAIEPQDGVVSVTVPTGVLRAYARYDNLLLAPVLGTDPPASLAQLSGVAPVGPGGPVYVTNPAGGPDLLVDPEPVLVKAMAAYFTKPHAKVYKTIWCYCSPQIAAPPAVQVRSNFIVGGFANFAFYSLPAFTRKVKILRFPTSVGLAVLLHNGIRPVDFITIPGGATAAEINVIGDENIIGISSSPDVVTMLALVCEIGI